MEAIDTHSEGSDGRPVAEPHDPNTGSSVLRRRPDTGEADPATGRALLQFFRTGTLPPDTGLSSGLSGHVPALLFPYLSQPGIRTPWPVVLDIGDGTTHVKTLSSFVDDVSEAVGGTGDEGELRHRFLARVEGAIRMADHSDDTNLEEAWWAAVDAVRPAIRSERREAFEECMRAASGHLSGTARLIVCTVDAPIELAKALAGDVLQEVARPVVEEAERLLLALRNLLDVEREESHEAVVPERLKVSAGGAYADAFDFDALSHLLDEAPHVATLPAERRERMDSRAAGLAANIEALFGRPDSVLKPVSVRGAREAVSERTERLVALFRDLEAARLEVAHRYRPEIHDGYLDALSPAMLSPEDLGHCPPVFVHADEASLDAAGIGHVLELLSGTVPVKVFLVLRGAVDDPEDPSVAAVLPSVVIGNGRACVVQTTLSDFDTLSDGIAEAIRHAGPALVAIHAGIPGSDLPVYFASAMARDGRAAPSFVYRPGVGRPWADRISVSGNDALDSDWIAGVMPVEDDGIGEEIPSTFTWLDFAAACPSLSGYYLPVTKPVEDGLLVPGDEYLALDAESRAGSVPFVWCASADGLLVRAVPARPLVCAAEQALDRWRRLQELAGIGNSYADRAVEELRGELEAERDAAIASVNAAHAEELDRTISSVAESIVSNIAASLLDLPAGAPAPSVRASAPVAAPPVEQSGDDAEVTATESAPEPEEEPEESLSLDEAYVETIRCTSCNECTNLNGRIFAYNEEKQAFIKDASAGPYRDLVTAAEKCPVRIIHPGKPLDPGESGLDDLLERAKPFL